MSGGAMDYVYGRIYDIAHTENDLVIKKLLNDLADYLYAEEWWLSGDTDYKDYEEARKKFKAKWLNADTPVDIKQIIDEKFDEMRVELYKAVGISEKSKVAHSILEHYLHIAENENES